jgi:hypothetical protein
VAIKSADFSLSKIFPLCRLMKARADVESRALR